MSQIRSKEWRVIALWMIVLASACGDAQVSNIRSENRSGPTGEAPSPDLSIAQQILTLANSYRAESGLAPLILNTQLNQAAQAHAESMATLGFFSHDSPDGTPYWVQNFGTL